MQKGGALLDDMRLLVRSWSNGCTAQQRNSIVAENVLGKESRAHAVDTYRRAFLPRFIQESPPAAWKIVRQLEDREVPILRSAGGVDNFRRISWAGRSAETKARRDEMSRTLPDC
jgi:hypothetical protein